MRHDHRRSGHDLGLKETLNETLNETRLPSSTSRSGSGTVAPEQFKPAAVNPASRLNLEARNSAGIA